MCKNNSVARKAFNKNIKSEDEIEITNEDYGLRMVKTIRQENYNNDIWDQWFFFRGKFMII